MTNKSKGRRLSSLVSLEQQKLAAAGLLCSPFLPLLFIGQEYGETAPFLFFTSFQEATLVEAVRDGRRKEFAANDADTDFPGSQAEATFQQSKLDWAKLPQPPFTEVLSLYRNLLSLRRRYACLNSCRKDLTEVAFDEKARWLGMMRADPSGERLLLICNFSEHAQPIAIGSDRRRWELPLWTADPTYGGNSGATRPPNLIAAGDSTTGIPVRLLHRALSLSLCW